MSNETMIELLRAVMIVMLVHLVFYYRSKRNFWRERYQKSEEYIQVLESQQIEKRKNDEVGLRRGQVVQVDIPMGIDANGQMQTKPLTAYYRGAGSRRVSD